MKTKINSLYTSEDMRKKSLRHVASLVGDGAIAALQIQEYLETLG